MISQYTSKQFDFSSAIDAFLPLLIENHPDRKIERFGIGKALLAMPQFPEYAAHYFAQPGIWNTIHRYRTTSPDDNRLPTSAGALAIHSEFLSSTHPESGFTAHVNEPKPKSNGFAVLKPPASPIRMHEIYALTYDDAMKSAGFLREEDDLLLAIIGIKRCLNGYFQDLRNAVTRQIINKPGDLRRKDSVRSSEFRDISETLIRNIDSPTFTEEFAPILADRLRREQSSTDESALRHGFHNLFNKQAFKSVSKQGEYTECPFSKALMRVMRIDLVRNNDGNLIPVENSYPGALINFARREIIATGILESGAVPPDSSPKSTGSQPS